MKRSAPAAERNRSVILATMGPRLPARGLVLEVASGTGQHIAAFAHAHPNLDWQPSDPDPDARASADAYRQEHPGNNLRAAVDLDVRRPWPIKAADGVVALININMIHISPWAATEALFAGANAVVGSEGPLMLYGPFKRNGHHTAPSNASFDQWLKSRDPGYGVRDLEDVVVVADRQNFEFEEAIAMPANNFTVLFRRR